MRLLVLALLASLGAAPAPRYDVAPESRLWIDGTATTGPWTCQADGVVGQAEGDPSAPSGRLAVPVRAFDCGSGLMNRDLAEALGADDHPTIAFDLDAVGRIAPAPPDAWVEVVARGTLRLAGTARVVTVRARGRRRADGRVELDGRQPLRMSAFGVRPPSHAAGLVRAQDAIVVRFSLVAVSR
ncbi:YceI family protein [Rubrivirga sp. IMCC43871]|uniref:YceI family protein n=1 Tax=Rubrivirga sp. IMCC43871 TaxID=3391575 RepID=UPI00398FC252